MKVRQAALAPTYSLADRLADYLELTKPRIGVLVLVTVAIGGYVGAGGQPPLLLIHAVLGTALVAASSSILNQYYERRADGRMPRTMNRPLPAGRVTPTEALVLAAITGVAGTVYLWTVVGALPALLALTSLVVYVWIYTPLKPRSSLNTMVGAVAGAIPPVIGWTAMTGRLDWGAAVLFGILFFWQFPHFLAIAWLYREDYRRGGMRMLPVGELGDRLTGVQALSYTLVLVPVSLLPTVLGLAGPIYFWGALILGTQFLAFAARFAYRKQNASARQLLYASLLYLPAILALWMVDLQPGPWL